MSKTSVLDDIKETDSGVSSDHYHTLNALNKNDYLRKIVVLKTQGQSKAYALLEHIGSSHNNKFIKGMVEKTLEYNISVAGRGRTDIVEVSKFKTESEHGFMNKFLGFSGRGR